jgi:hypothetical protein
LEELQQVHIFFFSSSFLFQVVVVCSITAFPCLNVHGSCVSAYLKMTNSDFLCTFLSTLTGH